MGHEDVPQGDPIWASTLTSERVERLNSIGFVWSITGPLPTWEDRFKEMMECYKSTGNWPDQSKGPLYKWVCRQRGLYAKKDETFMKEKAPKVRKRRSFYYVCLDENEKMFDSLVFA